MSLDCFSLYIKRWLVHQVQETYKVEDQNPKKNAAFYITLHLPFLNKITISAFFAEQQTCMNYTRSASVSLNFVFLIGVGENLIIVLMMMMLHVEISDLS